MIKTYNETPLIKAHILADKLFGFIAILSLESDEVVALVIKMLRESAMDEKDHGDIHTSNMMSAIANNAEFMVRDSQNTSFL